MRSSHWSSFTALILTALLCMQCATGPKDTPQEQGAKPEKENARQETVAERPWNAIEFNLEDCTDKWATPEEMKSRLGKLQPYALKCDLSNLSLKDRKVLALLTRTSYCMDKAFSFQVYEWNYCLEALLNRTVTPGVELYEDYFKVMFGPWDRLDEEKPFLVEEAKPPGANYYPKGMTREEFEAHIESYPEEKAVMESNFTMIRRENDRLKAVPYSLFFKDQLLPAVELMKKAAETTEESTLRAYLYGRAVALLSNNYFQSDMDWMDLDGPIEVVIGPYEVYEDRLFGYKAAFQSQVCITDSEESRKLKSIETRLVEMEKNLPIAEQHKNFDRGVKNPIKVVNQFFAGGDAKAGILTAAFNLPNDERVREAKGSKKVMLKNVMKAKFETCSIPIAEAVLADRDLSRVSFDAFFNLFLLHEVSHGLGPGRIVCKGRETTVNRELSDRYSLIEEAKADALAIYNIAFLVERGVLPRDLKETVYSTFLADLFRALRFGIADSHGGAMAIQLSYLLEKGAVSVDGEGLFAVNDDLIESVIEALSRELLMIQALGDYEAACAFVEKYRKLSPQTAAALKKLEHVPVDIRPLYPQAEALLEKEVDSKS